MEGEVFSHICLYHMECLLLKMYIVLCFSCFFGVFVQVQKATGLSCKIGAWGLPIVSFSRWESTQEVDSPTVQEGESSVNIADATTETSRAETSRAEVEQRLTQVTLEADR